LIYKIGDKTECSNYRRISLPSTSYKILSIILPSRLSPYVDEIIVGFSITDKLLIRFFFCIRQILEKKWEYNETVRQLFIVQESL
jgi:hypothetical protein